MFSSKKRKVFAAIAAFIVAASAVWYVAFPSSAATDKVYVCKYVGQPGVDERLKDGKNPIEVAVSSIQNNQWNGQVPGYFSDAQDRSYVLGYVGEIPEPTADDCPGPDNPPTVVPVPSQDSLDPCNQPGESNNVAWSESLPADTSTIDWSESNNGATRTATLIGDNVEWSDGTAAAIEFNLPNDSGLECDVPDREINVPVPSQVDPCGVNNAMWTVPADTDVFDWELLDNGHLTVTIIQDGIVFYEGVATTPTMNDYGLPVDSGKLCDEGEIGVSGDVSVSSACESITIGTPTYSPTDGVVTIKLNGKSVQPGTYGVKPGEYNVGLFVNDEFIQAHREVVKKCASGGNTGGSGDLNNPAYANTGH